MEDHMGRATAHLRDAITADEAGRHEEALDKYVKGVEWLLLARKYSKDEALRNRLGSRAETYMGRMEELKAILRSAPPPHQPSSARAPQPQKEKPTDADELRSTLERTIMSVQPTERLRDVVGLEGAKRALSEAALMPIQAPQLWDEGERSWAGILLYGPPGTGKTFLAKAIAGEGGSTFFSVSASDLLSKWVGQSEGLIKALFELARERKPSIVFIDEVDSLLAQRGGDSGSASADRVVAEMLSQMDGAGKDNTGILIISATNIPWKLDAAAIRRAEKRIYIPLPDESARKTMISRSRHAGVLSPEDLDKLAAATEGFSCDDIRLLVKKVDMSPRSQVSSASHFRCDPREVGAYIPCFGECTGGAGGSHDPGTCLDTDFVDFPDKTLLRLPLIAADDYFKALSSTRPSVNQETLAAYVDFTERLGSM